MKSVIGMTLIMGLILTCSSCGNATLTNEVPIPVDAEKSQTLLNSEGYGYVYGDVVLLDTKTPPAEGDIILYDWHINKSDYFAFGPRYQLGKIIALPGDDVKFEKWSYSANGNEVELRQHNTPETTNVAWGTEVYGDVAGLTLRVPDEEYLADHYIGQQSLREEPGEVQPGDIGHRFTIKQAAISGVVIKKTGHENIPQVTY
jgi:hypothetical protein